MQSNIKTRGVNFHRFEVLWTPTVLVLDPAGIERHRIEGYLPRTEFRASLEMGLGRTAFMHKRWEEAEHRYGAIAEQHAGATVAPEAVYWRGVCQYKRMNDHTVLGPTAAELRDRYPGSVWTLKALVWLG